MVCWRWEAQMATDVIWQKLKRSQEDDILGSDRITLTAWSFQVQSAYQL